MPGEIGFAPRARRAMAVAALGLMAGVVGCGGRLPSASPLPRSCLDARHNDASPLTCPSKGGLAWREVTTQHFVLRTDLAEECAVAVAVDLEQTYASLRDIAFLYDIEPPGRITALIFARDADLRALGVPDYVGGGFREGTNAWQEPILMATSLKDIDHVRSTLRHELTHRFVAFYYAQAPTWLDEGLATYWQTLTVQDGVAYLGRPTHPRVFGPTRWQGSVASANLDKDGYHHFWITVPQLPGIRQLRSSSPTQFYARDVKDAETAGIQRVSNYIASGSWVGWLRTGPYARHFEEYLRALSEARSDHEAWSRAFRGVDIATIDAAWRKSLESRFDTVQRTKYELPAVPAPTHRFLDDAAVHLAWIDARWDTAARGEKQRRDFADIAEAELRAPGDALVAFARGGVRLQAGLLDLAIADVEKAIALRPGETRFLEGLLSIRYRQDLRASPPRWDRVEALAARLRAAPDASYRALNSVAWLSALRATPDDALEISKRSIRREPGCFACYDTLAALLYQSGDLEGALGSQQRALSLAGEGRVEDDIVSRLRFYERTWTSKQTALRAGTSWTAPELTLEP